MNRVDLLAQLIHLKQRYAPTGESNEQLAAHFQDELDNREIIMIQEEGQVVAFCDWSWVSSLEDMEKARKGIPTTGEALFLLNVVCTRPGIIWRLKEALPAARWVIGGHRDKIRAPHGLPDSFFQVA